MKLAAKTEILFQPLRIGNFLIVFLFLVCVPIFYSCTSSTKPPVTAIVADPEEIDRRTSRIIEKFIDQAISSRGQADDTILLRKDSVLEFVYEAYDFDPLWSSKGHWLPVADSMFNFIKDAKLYGLFPEDYHFDHLHSIRQKFIEDTSATGGAKSDAVLWAQGDIMFTDAFVQIANDLKLGRIPSDSITMRKDSVISDSFYKHKLDSFLKTGRITAVMESMEPTHKGYKEIKAGLRKFLDSADFTDHTYIHFPTSDSMGLKRSLQERLFESGFVSQKDTLLKPEELSAAIKIYQESAGLKADGKPGAETIRSLNNFDKEKFIRVAITLDRFKHLPPQLPEKYLWVNIPSYYLQLIESDTVRLLSRIVVGKSHTRTPVLTSALTDMITYPQWTVPTSIITKEIIPEAKKNPGYFAEKGFSLVDAKGEEVDPYFVDWSLYKKDIPFKVVQGSGDDNALGVLKFNFSNKYAVYLHDTNQRHFFKNAMRALSHGCVRVQEWQKLAWYILENDSLNLVNNRFTPTDSVRKWLSIKEKHVVPVRNRIPLYIRYFTCEGKNNELVFHDDIYGEDRRLRVKHFTNK